MKKKTITKPEKKYPPLYEESMMEFRDKLAQALNATPITVFSFENQLVLLEMIERCTALLRYEQ